MVNSLLNSRSQASRAVCHTIKSCKKEATKGKTNILMQLREMTTDHYNTYNLFLLHSQLNLVIIDTY